MPELSTDIESFVATHPVGLKREKLQYFTYSWTLNEIPPLLRLEARLKPGGK